MPRPLTPSPSLESVPALNMATAVVLTPSSYSTWAAMFSANLSKKQFLITPGDYTSWGQMSINKAGTSPTDRKIIRYYNSATPSLESVHPCLRSESDRAVVGSIIFSGTSPNNWYWFITGLTGRPASGTSWNTGQGAQAQYVTWDFCHLDAVINYGVRVHSPHVTVQRCVLSPDLINGTNDVPGLQIGNTNPVAIYDVKFLDNEIINWADGIQLSDSVGGGLTPYSDVLIEGNDVYVTESVYVSGGTQATTENGIDIKAGADVTDAVILRNNRWWGFRLTDAPPGEAGSIGNAIAIHRYGRNITIEDDIVGDCPNAIIELAWPTGGLVSDQNTPRYTNVRGLWCHDVRTFGNGADGEGACTRANGNTVYEDLRFARCDYAVYKHTIYRPSDPTFTGCIRTDTDTFHPNSYAGNPYDEDLNTVVLPSGYYDTYERKRWTGVETVAGVIPLVTGIVDRNLGSPASNIIGAVSIVATAVAILSDLTVDGLGHLPIIAGLNKTLVDITSSVSSGVINSNNSNNIHRKHNKWTAEGRNRPCKDRFRHKHRCAKLWQKR